MKFIKFLALLLAAVPMLNLAQEDELTWPREFDFENGVVTLYQPQLDSFKSDTLEGRMAVSIKTEKDSTLFCAVWFKAKMTTDLDERTATLESIHIERIHFPGLDDEEKISKLSKILVDEIESWDAVMSLDRLIADLESVEDIKKLSVDLNNDPPDIYFRTSSTTLLSIDGEPILKDIENTDLQYVVNCAFFIVKEKNKPQYYIKGGKFWYVSDEIIIGWKETKSIPTDIKKLAENSMTDQEPDSVSESITEAPEIIVVTKPSELITTNGAPNYQAINKTQLLYVQNSESDIIMDINSQEHYILLAGRWYHSITLKDGDWKFTEPSDLPEDFLNIPDDSDIANVRSSIPNTPEALDAVLGQSIPQTATVDRKTAKVEVSYDGNPEFKKIEDTDVAYAINSDKSVLRINNKYYCVDDAIWFVSDEAVGPWIVSDVRPDEVDQIPPESEVYNVKYVYVYNSTPEVVYVGYYPGYTHSYVYHGVVVYGTGYYYYPWYRTVYYPRPVTYGYGVHYNPYTGWGFHVGFRYGWVGWGFHPYHRHYWGPSGYRYGYRHGYHRGYHHGYRAGYYAGQKNPKRNVYGNRPSGGRPANGVRPGNSGRPQSPATRDNKARISNRPNNMYTDKNGNVYERNKGGDWTQKSNNKATRPSTLPSQRYNKTTRPSTLPSQRDNKMTRPSTQPSTRQSQQRPSNSVNKNNSRNELNKSYQSRSRGSSNYNRAQSSSNRARPSGGGGRRR